MIRFATEEDAQALLAIYAYYIDTEITFEYELPTEAEFRKRIRTVLEEISHISFMKMREISLDMPMRTAIWNGLHISGMWS